MINSNATLNITSFNYSIEYYSLDYWLNAFGSNYFIDSIYLFLLPPLSLFGLILNVIAFKVLSTSQFQQIRLYDYQKVYLINSSCVCLASIFTFLLTRLFINFYSYEANIYIAHVYLTVINVGYFYSGSMDVFIVLDRISILKNKQIRIINKYSPYSICFALLILVLIVEIPYYFKFYAASITVSLSPTENITLQYVGSSEFSRSPLGLTLSNAQYIIRDFLTISVSSLLNAYSIYLLKKLHTNKLCLLGINRKITYQNKSTQTDSNYRIISRKTVEYHEEIRLISTNQRMHKTRDDLSDLSYSSDSSSTIKVKAKKRPDLNIAEKKITIMVVIISLMSVIIHIFECFGVWYFTYYIDTFGFTLAVIGNSLHAFKSSSNFFIYMIFDRKFRNNFKRLFRK
jgi:hypothetical protein